MSSQSGTAIAPTQVFVNKAARKIVVERKKTSGQQLKSENRPSSSSTILENSNIRTTAIDNLKNELIINESKNSSSIIENSKNSSPNFENSKNNFTPSTTRNDELEEGEIDAEFPSTSSSSIFASTTSIFEKNFKKENGNVEKIDLPPTTIISSNDNFNSTTDGGEPQNSVQKKLTALERLKSLNFAKPKSAVNPFTLAVVPKPATISASDYKNEKHEKKYFRPPPPLPQQQQQPQPSNLPPPTKKPRQFRFDQQQQQSTNRNLGFENNQHSRHGWRSTMTNADGGGGNFQHFKTPTMMGKPSFNSSSMGNQSISHLRNSRKNDFALSNFDDYHHQAPPPSSMTKPFGNWPPQSHQQEIPDAATSSKNENRYTPPPPMAIKNILAHQHREDDSVREENLPSTSSAVDWERVRELTIDADDLDNASVNDLRAIVQYLLDEETELIQLHLRLQDQMKNVRRTLDREKQIGHLKKQAAIAALKNAVAKEMEISDSQKREQKNSSIDDDQKIETAKEEESTDEDQSGDQMDYDNAIVKALKETIAEQASVRKAHLLQYVTSQSGQHQAATEYEAGGSAGPSSSYQELSTPSSSAVVPKEIFVTMLKSFFDGAASMNDRSLAQENAPS